MKPEKSEEILSQEKAHLIIEDKEILGYCYLTHYRFVLKLQKQKNENNNISKSLHKLQKDFFEIPIFLINKLEKQNDRKNNSKYYIIEIGTKDQRNFKIIIINEDKKFYNSLYKILNPKDFSDFLKYTIKYRENHPVNNDGWEKYKMIDEFKRQGVLFENSNIADKFRLSKENSNFELCQTYPRKLIVPKSITDEELKLSSTFRTKNRVPTLCFYDSKNKSSLWRSSQTKSGLTHQRNNYDEKLLKSIADTSNGKITIFDARPYLNALANRFKGAGFENTDNYINSEIIFCEIDNIHSVKSSYNKVLALCNNKLIHENKKFLSLLDQTGWFDFIHQILKSSIDIVKNLKRGNSVLIHCSDGWDRSTQLTSLTQLLIDPYYRTLEGFIILIEKEWLSFGHQFGLRNGFYTKELSQDERCPIFLQWLDCVNQLIYQFPNLFEFNSQLLLFIVYHLNTAKYGSFLFNSEFERKSKNFNAKNLTVSIWTDILESRFCAYDNNIPFNAENMSGGQNLFFTNPFFNEDANKSNGTIYPNYGYNKLKLWEENFMRYIILPDYGKFQVKFELSKNFIYSDTSMRNTLNYFNNSKEKILNNVFYELEKKNELMKIKEKDDEINKLKETIKDLCMNVNFSISDFCILSNKTKEVLEDVSNSNGVEKEGYITMKVKK